MVECAVIVAVGNSAHVTQLNRTRAMLPALGKPLVVRMMDRLYRVGIRKYVVIVGESEGEVASYLSRHWVPNVSVEFILKWSNISLLRTLADYARRARQPFLVTSYNSFTHAHFPATLLNKYQQGNANELVLSGALATLSRTNKPRYALTEAQRVTGIVREVPAAKQTFTLSDIAICGHDFVNFLCAYEQSGGFDKNLVDIYQMYIQGGGAASLVETAWTLPIETDYDLLTLNRHLLDEEQDAHILSELHYTVQITPPVRIDPQVSVGQGAKIGPYVYLERGCSIGYDAMVRNTIVLKDTTVVPGDKVSDAIVSTRGRITR
ncbi:MAG: NDP-sugar synthase [Chloroflexi bacterium]|nr:NDP-sugar synthase [Chloroflexota bacterium]